MRNLTTRAGVILGALLISFGLAAPAQAAPYTHRDDVAMTAVYGSSAIAKANFGTVSGGARTIRWVRLTGTDSCGFLKAYTDVTLVARDARGINQWSDSFASWGCGDTHLPPAAVARHRAGAWTITFTATAHNRNGIWQHVRLVVHS